MDTTEQTARIVAGNAVVRPALDAIITAGIMPGAVYAILDGDDTYIQVLGQAATAPVPLPLDAGMFYDLASLTKVVGTTPLFLRAVQDGLLGVDQPIKDVLPEFTAPHVTFRMALTHTSGLDGYIPHRDELPPDELRHALLTQLHETAGTGHVVQYRDVNLLLVGWALAKVYGDPIQRLITARVLPAFGMRTNATFSPDVQRTVPTTYDTEGGLRRGVVHDPKSAILGVDSGAAGLFANIDGMVQFAHVTFGRVQQIFLHENWAEKLQRDFAGGRSLGFDLREGPVSHRQWLYHTGYTGTFMLLDPTAHRGLIVLANRVHPVVHPEFLDARDRLIPRFLSATESA